jgi:ankyrin repeat protein
MAYTSAKDKVSRMRLLRVTNECQAIIGKLFKIGNSKANCSEILFWAVGKNLEVAVFQMLLDTSKIDVNAKNSYGRTPLFIACANGNVSIARLLVEIGKANVNKKDSYGQTPLLEATKKGHDAVVTMLLDTGNADINLKDKNGKTPLLLASENGLSS